MMGVPWKETTTSPSSMPAFSAGLSSETPETYAPSLTESFSRSASLRVTS